MFDVVVNKGIANKRLVASVDVSKAQTQIEDVCEFRIARRSGIGAVRAASKSARLR